MRVLSQLTTILLILTLIIPSHSFASNSVSTDPMKVLGRGVTVKYANAPTLQVACVGERLEKNLTERSCNKIQFVVIGKITDEDAKFYKLEKVADALKTEGGLFIGPVFELIDGKKVKKQLTSQLIPLGIVINSKENLKYGLIMTGLTTAGVFSVSFGPLSVLIASILSGFIMVSSLAGPVMFDPIETRLINSKSIRELQNRASSAWQFKPKKVRAKNFFLLLQKLSSYSISSHYIDGTPISNTKTTQHIPAQFMSTSSVTD